MNQYGILQIFSDIKSIQVKSLELSKNYPHISKRATRKFLRQFASFEYKVSQWELNYHRNLEEISLAFESCINYVYRTLKSVSVVYSLPCDIPILQKLSVLNFHSVNIEVSNFSAKFIFRMKNSANTWWWHPTWKLWCCVVPGHSLKCRMLTGIVFHPICWLALFSIVLCWRCWTSVAALLLMT